MTPLSRRAMVTVAGALCLCTALLHAYGPAVAAQTPSPAQLTVLFDSFGKDASLEKDWGYSALVEIAGKRILFDTGNDPEVFAHNVKAKGSTLPLSISSCCRTATAITWAACHTCSPSIQT